VYPLQVIAREDGKLDVRRRDALRCCALRSESAVVAGIAFRVQCFHNDVFSVSSIFIKQCEARACREVILRRFLKRKQVHRRGEMSRSLCSAQRVPKRVRNFPDAEPWAFRWRRS
jgi:hypothetical protein